MELQIQYNWQRLWIPLGYKYSLDSKGFPDYNFYDFHAGQINTEAKTLKDLENFKCLILIGDPGIGKSTEITLINHAENSITLKYYLKDYASTAELFEVLSNNLDKKINFEGRLFLYFDGLDEGLLNIRNLHDSLINKLKSIKNKEPDLFDKINLRVSCRSVVWSEISESLTPTLRSIFSDDKVKLVELAPLRKKDIILSVEQHKLSSNDFLTLICDNNLQSFCSDPQSLNSVIESYKLGRIKSGIQKVELFETLVKQKCIELNSKHKREKSLTPEQRLNIAARIAAYCILSNKNSIWIDEDSNSAQNYDLILDEIIGDNFKVDQNKYLLNNKRDLREVIDTSLFSIGNHNSRYHFKHRGEQEFLAAWHISRLKLVKNQITQILTSPYDNSRGIPQLQEVIIWLATINKNIFDLMVDKNPLILIRCERELDISERKKILKSLILNAKSFGIVDSYDDERFYSRLKFDGIEKTLKPYLNERSNIFLLRICLHLAKACSIKSLQSELLRVLHNSYNSTYIRRQAIEVLAKYKDVSIMKELVKYAKDEIQSDIDDEIKGAALIALYPGELSIQEVLESLTPVKRNNLYGAYRGFLDTLSDIIPDHDLVIAIKFISNWKHDLLVNQNRPLEELKIKIIERGYTKIDTGDTLKSIVKCIKVLLRDHVTFSVPTDLITRRRILQALINNWDSELFITTLIKGRQALIDPSDWNWLIDQLEDTQEYNVKTLWVKILRLIVDLNDAKKTIQFFEIAYQFKEITEVKSLFNPVQLNSNDAKTLKDLYQRPNVKVSSVQDVDYEVNFVSGKIREVFDNLDKGQTIEWWRLLHYLGGGNDFEFSLKQKKYWLLFGEPAMDKIIRYAESYLTEYSPRIEYDKRELSGYSAILFLKKERSDFFNALPDSFWTRWLDVVIYCSLNDNKNELDDDQKEILKRCQSVNSMHFEKSLLHQIELFLNKKSVFFLSKIEFIIDRTIGEELIRLLVNLKMEDSDYLLNIVFNKCLPIAKEFALGEVRTFYESRLATERIDIAINCGSKLLEYLEGTEWDEYWQYFIGNQELAKRIFLNYVSGIGRRPNLQHLNARQKGDIFRWLYVNFPKSNDPIHQTVYSPSSRDWVVDYRSELIGSIIQEGSLESVKALKRLMFYFPKDDDIKWWFTRALEFMRRNTWEPISPIQMRIMFNGNEVRVVRSPSELTSIVIESLERLERKLQGKNPTSFFLWNNNEMRYVPKDENSLSDFVKMHLEYDLVGRKIIVNREVEIKRGSGRIKGARTDLLIQAFNSSKNESSISLVIETKKCTHQDVFKAIKDQLKDRYLSHYKASAGIYLVGWYYCDYLRSPKNLTKQKFSKKLQKIAVSLCDDDVELTSLTINCGI